MRILIMQDNKWIRFWAGIFAILIFCLWILLSGCTRRYKVQFVINAPETLASTASNYQ